MYAIETKQLFVSYDGRVIIDDFSFTMHVGETVLLKGPSGCGKSTFLHAVCGLIPESAQTGISGEVLLFGKDICDYGVAERADAVGIVFQNPETQLFCGNVEDELAFGLENLCIAPVEIGSRIDETLAFTGLEKYRRSHPKSLSGGQKQLVVLSAVLAMRPRILLLDEAMSQLDDGGRRTMIEKLRALKDEGRTILSVDHDGVSAPFADRVVDLGQTGFLNATVQ